MEKILLKKIFKIKNKITSSILSDELDKIGLANQVLINWTVNNNKPIMGFARTVLIKESRSGDENIKLGLSFLDKLSSDDILIVNGSNNFAYFGELMTRLSIKKGFKGAIINGKTRDSIFTKKKKNFTIFSKGYSPIDIKLRGRVFKTDVSIKIKKTNIKKNDIIYADEEGVVIIPKECLKKLIPGIEKSINNELKVINLINNDVSIKNILKQVKEF